ncbi:hypothetical protein K492DRAFT_171396 [Lichtheimia hyalospora FSU 10163]|nr:hypothetical protein K492DRAFT_171396 [Lichtheimia hyalospora FSU 10163]
MFFQASYFMAANRRVVFALRAPSTTATTTTTAAAAKKNKKSVRFSGVDTVRYTHSPSEYDRSTRRPTRPLRIDTQLGTNGPRFFTRLSTNYGRPTSMAEEERTLLFATC